MQGCMLLGGKGEEEISAYFFKPIQRVCKYPLLFRVSWNTYSWHTKQYSCMADALNHIVNVNSVHAAIKYFYNKYFQIFGKSESYTRQNYLSA